MHRVGDTVSEVLGYVEFDRRDLVAKVRRSCESAVRAGQMTPRETRALLRCYEDGLNGYTYLVTQGAEQPQASEATRRSESSTSGAYPKTPRTRTESPAPRDGP